MSINVGLARDLWCLRPWARSHLHLAGLCPSHASFVVLFSCSYLRENSSLLGFNVTVPSHLSHSTSGLLSHWTPLACEGTPSFNLGIMKVMSTWIFVSLTGYCHIGSQWGGVRTQMQVDDWAVKEPWEGRGLAEWRCDLTLGMFTWSHSLWRCKRIELYYILLMIIFKTIWLWK